MDVSGLSVVPAKTRRPRLAPVAIVRVGLLDRLDSVLEQPLTLVTAPAGFGKTWLVVEWLDAHQDAAQCWITVDRDDHDPIRFWLHLIEAVEQSSNPAAAAEASRLARSTGVGVPLIVNALAEGLAKSGEAVVIVLDDAHLLDGDNVLRSLDDFLTFLPHNCHMILVGRRDPALPLASRRLTGDLLEIRMEDLRCSLAETQMIVSESLGLGLAEESIGAIHRKTMGWLAGIRLMAPMTLRKGDVEPIAVDDAATDLSEDGYQAVADYLIEEALGDLEEADRRFLLDTSILIDLTGPLCAAVSGRGDSAEVLERLERRGMFTSRTDTAGDWYRYHGLFRDTLWRILTSRDPAREADLHRRAAHWLHDRDQGLGAIRHAIAAGEPDLAAIWLVEASRALLVARQFDTLWTLFEEVREASSSPSSVFLSTRMFAALFSTASGVDIDRVLDQAREALCSMGEDEGESDSLAHVPYLFHLSIPELVRGVDATIAHRRGDVDLAFRAHEEQGDIPSESGWVEGSAGESHIWLERYATGLELHSRWSDYCFSPMNPILSNQAYVLAFQAYAALGEGRLADAEALAGRGVEVMRASGLADMPQTGVAIVPLAWVAWERGEIDTAESLIESAIENLDRLGEVPAYVMAHVLLARVRNSRGDRSAAAAVLEEATVTPSGRVVTGFFADKIILERSRVALLAGDLVGARVALPDWRRRIDEGAGTMLEHLLLTRFAIAAGDDPTPLLESPPEDAEVTRVHQIEMGILRALAARRDGHDAVALDHLVEAMRAAGDTGHRQIFLDDRHALGALLDKASAASGHRLRVPRRSGGVAGMDPVKVPTLLEPLTERELGILRLLAGHLTNGEIAQEVYLSVNTIKFHVRAIYSKLGVGSRSEAVEAGRALQLID